MIDYKCKYKTKSSLLKIHVLKCEYKIINIIKIKKVTKTAIKVKINVDKSV